MKIRTFVEIEQEVEVEVSIADVMSSIAALTESDQLPMILDCISSVHRVLLAIPSWQIAAMNDKQRAIIREALLAQSDRFALPPYALGKAPAEASNT